MSRRCRPYLEVFRYRAIFAVLLLLSYILACAFVGAAVVFALVSRSPQDPAKQRSKTPAVILSLVVLALFSSTFATFSFGSLDPSIVFILMTATIFAAVAAVTLVADCEDRPEPEFELYAASLAGNHDRKDVADHGCAVRPRHDPVRTLLCREKYRRRRRHRHFKRRSRCRLRPLWLLYVSAKHHPGRDRADRGDRRRHHLSLCNHRFRLRVRSDVDPSAIFRGRHGRHCPESRHPVLHVDRRGDLRLEQHQFCRPASFLPRPA